MTKPNDTDAGAPTPWLTMPDREDEAAVEAWLASMAQADAQMEAEGARTLDACVELFEEVGELAGVDLKRPLAC